MNQYDLPIADSNGIICALPTDVSEVNRKRISKFGTFMFMYDFFQNHWVRPRIHKANPKKHRQIMHEMIAPVEEASVLDIACGTGAAIAYFHSSNDYTGLDLSYAMLRQAAKKAKKKEFRKYTLVEGNAEELLFTNESFNFALIDTSLHMIPEYQMCIAEVARVLKKGGNLICSCPTLGINEEFDASWAKIAPKRQLHSLKETDFQAVCSSNGLVYERIATNGGVLYFHALRKKMTVKAIGPFNNAAI
jgi:ubiquinone/menaquinone biosynthesis C-methylase UbiE